MLIPHIRHMVTMIIAALSAPFRLWMAQYSFNETEPESNLSKPG